MFTSSLSAAGKVYLLFSLFLLTTELRAQTPVLSFTEVMGITLVTPMEAVSAHDGTNRMFIVEKGGLIKIYDGSSLLATPFLDLSSVISTDGERGLLSLAFAPDYATERYFFVYYTQKTTGNVTVARYRTPEGTPNVADLSSGVVLLTISKPAANHNGGHLQFGPDGYLYFATGDGGGAGDPPNNAQNGNSLLGKMIRLDVNNSDISPYYTIPADNPFVTDPTVRDEIWAIGLRNPFRWSFDSETHDMWIGDVGQGAREEIDFREAGQTGGINYGWKCYEGDLPYAGASGCGAIGNYTFPIFDYTRDDATGGQCVTGGVVYRGNTYPALKGYYMCVDYLSNNGWLIKRNGAAAPTITMQANLPDGIVSFSEAENGEVYAVSLNNNKIYQVGVNVVLPLTLERFLGKAKGAANELSWKTSAETNVSDFEVEYSVNGTDFRKAGTVAASNLPQGKDYTFIHSAISQQVLFYRLKMVDKDQKFNYSYVIKIDNGYTPALAIIPSLLRQGDPLIMQLKVPFIKLELIDMNGQLRVSRQLAPASGEVKVGIGSLPKGVYVLRITNGEASVVKRVLVQ